VAIIALVLLGAVGYFGFFVQVQTKQAAVVLRFGKFDRIMPEGLRFRLPYPIEEVHILEATRQNQFELGKRASAQTFSAYSSSGSSPLDESHMLTGDENIVNINFIMTWQIGDPKDYLFNLQNPEKTIKDVAESAMREVIGQREYQSITTSGRGEVQDAVKALTQSTLDKYKSGIQVLAVQLTTVEAPHSVQDAFRDVQAAKADKDRMQNEAEAYRNTEIPNARGLSVKIRQDAQAYKEQTVAEAIGRTKRFISVYDEYAKAPEVTRKRMFLETMEVVLGGANKIVLDEKGSGVVPYLPIGELNRAKGTQR
jgi:modulator of FtsH protease HflK